MNYALALTDHPTDPTRRAFRIIVVAEYEHLGPGQWYGVYKTHDALLVALEALLRMEASR